MMKKVNVIYATLLASMGMAVAMPAWAVDDDLYYQQHKQQFITHDKAAEIAINTVPDGIVEEVEFEKKRNGEFFDVELRDAQGQEYQVRIDAKSGKVIYSRRDH